MVGQRKFVQNPIGKECLGAFLQYSYTKELEAKCFQEILENSLTSVTYFCEHYLRLLNHRIKQHKEKVVCLISSLSKQAIVPQIAD